LNKKERPVGRRIVSRETFSRRSILDARLAEAGSMLDTRCSSIVARDSMLNVYKILIC
jgi:chorismate-pyruvate lyase